VFRVQGIHRWSGSRDVPLCAAPRECSSGALSVCLSGTSRAVVVEGRGISNSAKRTFASSSRSCRACFASVRMERRRIQASSRWSSVGRANACSSASRRLDWICVRIASSNDAAAHVCGDLFM
jgi:hypothetical protein